ncbi:MAG TPA: SIMPL domain-containing protein [Rhizomicrobium sp.]|nr:SIMPL domain-containing protein [Rhizomicrobium sp.]
MKSGFFIALALAASLSSALGQTASRTITMSGQGEVRATPDTVTLSAGVTSEAATAAAALTANSARMQAVFAALKKLGVADKDMQTSNFSVSPQMAGGGAGNQAPHITGYQARNQVRVRLDDVGKLGAALDTLVTAGANQMNGIDFGFKDDASLMAQARAGAVAQARAKAETYAKAAGVSLGPILSISENGYQGPRPLYNIEQVVVSASRIAPTAPGEESVTAEITIVWEIH